MKWFISMLRRKWRPADPLLSFRLKVTRRSTAWSPLVVMGRMRVASPWRCRGSPCWTPGPSHAAGVLRGAEPSLTSVILCRQQQRLLKALEQLEAEPGQNPDLSKQPVSQRHALPVRNRSGLPDVTSSVGVAERAAAAAAGRRPPCAVRYHGDPVQLGQRAAGRPDGAAVLLPQKQEAVRVAARHWHQERRPPGEPGGAGQREGQGGSVLVVEIYRAVSQTFTFTVRKRSDVWGFHWNTKRQKMILYHLM